MSTTSERLYETAQSLPEPLLAEVLDFAEFLRAKQANLQSVTTEISLSSMCGGLEHSSIFTGSPIAIQQQLRNEWR